MSDANTALIALVGVLAGGYINNFLGDDYRRFREGQALAGALAGELKSHGTAAPELKRQLTSMLSHVPSLDFTETEFTPPNSPVFDSSVSKLGLLGPALAEDVAYVYEQIRAFRITFSRVTKIAGKANHDQIAHMLNYCLTCITHADERGQVLVVNLQRFAADGYWRTRPWLSWIRTLG
ncbi:hypothetical protein [Burkholderia cepacia]|uniref:hypothetical protein n=1 Tax=Burkholderia cepacia TaxID=292 RepID=UPI000A8F0F8E|nr:hypothetical protein [Burkholderia cepacia]